MSGKNERNKPAPRGRRPRIATLLKEAAKGGKTVTSITLPDGTKLTFGDQTQVTDNNSWDEIYAADKNGSA
jgi:hypothetical protein